MSINVLRRRPASRFVAGCVAALLGLSAVAVGVAGKAWARPLIYAARCRLAARPGVGLFGLIGGGEGPSTTVFPCLPWIGARFRPRPLASFFPVVVNLGAAAASLLAIGYARHEEEPQRVLPFYPAFLAAMNLVVIADDAFSFLVAWGSCPSSPGLWSWRAAATRRIRAPLRLPADGQLRRPCSSAGVRSAGRPLR